MSITSEMQRLHTNINNIRENTDSILEAIANKGVTVPSGSKLDDVPGLIAQIPDGSNIIGGKAYKTVAMPDGKVWLAENLDYKFCNIGGSGDPSTANAWYYDNDESTYGWNGYKCGLLYNWYAVKFLNDNRSYLCPGWHVPTDDEWSSLVTACGASAGAKLKALDNSVALGFPSGWNGTDDYGFSIMPSGYRLAGDFHNFGKTSTNWTISEVSYRVFQYYFTKDSSSVIRSDGNGKEDAFSVRLVKDVQ